jgi:SAM-dependent methyltransferase
MFTRSYRSVWDKVVNFIFFPYRAFIMNPNQSTSFLVCLRDERMSAVAKYCQGKTLDVGCGPDNVFISHFYKNGVGVDFFKFQGLNDGQIISDPRKFPFADESFETITLIANINHIPMSVLEDEFKEMQRILKPGGRMVITRIGPITSVLTHNIVKLQSKITSHIHDMDSERGCCHDERYSVTKKEIKDVCGRNGLIFRESHLFWTVWCLNGLLVFEKPHTNK